LADHHPFIYYWFAFLGIILGRYFLVAGGTHLLIHSVLKQFFVDRGIAIDPPVWASLDSTNQLVPFSRQVSHQDQGSFPAATRSKATFYIYFDITFRRLQHLDRHSHHMNYCANNPEADRNHAEAIDSSLMPAAQSEEDPKTSFHHHDLPISKADCLN
jgi:hypothetical protein